MALVQFTKAMALSEGPGRKKVPLSVGKKVPLSTERGTFNSFVFFFLKRRVPFREWEWDEPLAKVFTICGVVDRCRNFFRFCLNIIGEGLIN